MVGFEQLNLMYRRQAGYAQKFTNRIERMKFTHNTKEKQLNFVYMS